ncbi:sigma-54-dependent Fis family transcriptional regulator [Paralimibaculum aggregatum]|uniref:Sigma-54-dependent Fis family transcriptional regulator n=1 Tax=Paralimibaculum aggregatum TaxID=3036245 RepID=A0ABQ6LL08_9RHOB|nr:sigma-54-dependent Fis family transcriptional regulator [Limibaculum sp. NKW23]GMG83111.1 sigma-54-dependent Fis family transcriptional regulator [Limibaculum sp. NKW23]
MSGRPENSDKEQTAEREQEDSAQMNRHVQYDERQVMKAWEAFVGGVASRPRLETSVRSLIHDSWSRSASLGIDADTSRAPIAGEEDQIERIERENARLLRAAQDTFDQIGPLLHDSNAMLILTDHEGTICKAMGDEETLRNGRKIHLEVGGVWSETVIGTNGIGTALSTRRPVFVHAAEHFCLGIKAWTCAAAPILDPLDQSLLGAVDLSGPTQIFQRHNSALVASAARAIQATLARLQKEERKRLLSLFHGATPALRSDDATLLLDRQGRIIHFSNIDGVGEAVRSGLAVGRRLLPLSEGMTDADIAAALPEGLRPENAVPLSLDGEFGGAALVLRRSGRRRAAKDHAVRLAARPDIPDDGIAIVGRSDALLEAVELTRRVARANVSVLVEGETGVGKELFARLIHSESCGAARGPFIPVNCGAVSKELFGAELFGHVAGAYTGASREGKPGKFELADGGVLCLDEIGEMPLDLQPYLLRVLEQRAVYRIGDNKRRPVDVRLVAMTNRDLRAESEAGRFRQDLYYRIGAVTIHVPPLRARRGDVELLIDHFNRRAVDAMGTSPLRFTDAAMERLNAWHWPGNVRELRNVVERLHLLARQPEVHPQDLPPEFLEVSPSAAPKPAGAQPPGTAPAAPAPDAHAPGSLEENERLTIKRVIEESKGNMTQAARTLGISRPTLYRKMRLHGIRRVYE